MLAANFENSGDVKNRTFLVCHAKSIFLAKYFFFFGFFFISLCFFWEGVIKAVYFVQNKMIHSPSQIPTSTDYPSFPFFSLVSVSPSVAS